MIKAIKDLTPTDAIDSAGSTVGEVTYNGFTFNAIRQVTMQGAMKYDEAGVTVTHVEYQMTVSGFIYGDDTAAQQVNMRSLHQKLTAAGKTLVIEGIGFDEDIDTSRGGVTPDVLWGAQPQSFQFRPIGGSLAWGFVWVVKFNLSRCESLTLANRFLAFNYGVTYSTNSEGLIERSIEGYVEIPQNRSPANARAIDWDIEAAWDQITFQLPICFRRLTTQRRFNYARNRIDFTIVDQELTDLPYPNGMVEADGEYDFENIGRSFENWVATLTVDLTVAPSLPRSLAAVKFFLILADKMAKLTATAQAADGAAIPMKLRLGVRLFGRQSRFQAMIQVVACLKEIVSSSGLWTPVAGTSYQQWSTSMNAAGVFRPRGVGQWRHTTSQDAIIDLCTPAQLPAMGNDTGNCLIPTADYQNPDLCPAGDPYLHWENELYAEQSQNVVIHRLSQLFGGPGTVSASVGVATFFPTVSSASAVIDHVAQYESAPDNYIVMVGRGLRLNKAPDVPQLLSVGGVPVVEVARKVVPKAVANYFGCTLIGVRWAILYRVQGQIKTVKPPNNKDLCFTDGEG